MSQLTRSSRVVGTCDREDEAGIGRAFGGRPPGDDVALGLIRRTPGGDAAARVSPAERVGEAL